MPGRCRLSADTMRLMLTAALTSLALRRSAFLRRLRAMSTVQKVPVLPMPVCQSLSHRILRHLFMQWHTLLVRDLRLDMLTSTSAFHVGLSHTADLIVCRVP